MLSAITALLAPDRTAALARSALPGSPRRVEALVVRAPRRSPGAARRATATALRRSADRVAPVIE